MLHQGTGRAVVEGGGFEKQARCLDTTIVNNNCMWRDRDVCCTV